MGGGGGGGGCSPLRAVLSHAIYPQGFGGGVVGGAGKESEYVLVGAVEMAEAGDQRRGVVGLTVFARANEVASGAIKYMKQWKPMQVTKRKREPMEIH